MSFSPASTTTTVAVNANATTASALAGAKLFVRRSSDSGSSAKTLANVTTPTLPVGCANGGRGRRRRSIRESPGNPFVAASTASTTMTTYATHDPNAKSISATPTTCANSGPNARRTRAWYESAFERSPCFTMTSTVKIVSDAATRTRTAPSAAPHSRTPSGMERMPAPTAQLHRLTIVVGKLAERVEGVAAPAQEHGPHPAEQAGQVALRSHQVPILN